VGHGTGPGEGDANDSEAGEVPAMSDFGDGDAPLGLQDRSVS
jgi:hypothetical protein